MAGHFYFSYSSAEQKTKEQQEETVPVLYEAFYEAVIDNKTILYKKINSTRNVKELSAYMRDGSFVEDAVDDFAAHMLAAMPISLNNILKRGASK